MSILILETAQVTPEPWSGDSVSRFKLRCSRLVDAEPGLLWLAAGFGTNWLEGGRMLGGACDSALGQMMDEKRWGRLILFGRAAMSKSCPRNHQEPRPSDIPIGIYISINKNN